MEVRKVHHHPSHFSSRNKRNPIGDIMIMIMIIITTTIIIIINRIGPNINQYVIS